MDICRDSKLCGGCSYQGVPYEEQLKNKEGETKSLLDRKDIRYGEFIEIEPAPDRFGYRNKMEYTFGDMEKGGPMTLGMHRKKHFMSIVTVDECQLVHEDFNRVLRAVLDFVSSRGYSHYHKKTHKGLMRHLILRRGVRTGELLVNVVTSSEEGFDEEAFTSMILSLPLENRVAGVLRTINDRLADAVYCDELRVLYGRDYYEEEIMGLKFKVSAFSFFQTNVEAVEKLYSYAIGLIDDFESKKVFDLYCGTGTISQAMAKSAGEVVGIEIVEEAVRAAEENAAYNGIENCRFISGDVFEVLDSLPENEKPDVIVVDPPRVGISANALDKIIGYGVDQIVYISCNPKSLAENLYYMQYYGYEVRSIKPFDNFPGTKHVETVVLLSKLNTKQHIEVELNLDELDLTDAEKKATYQEIKDYVLEHSGLKVSSLYIAQVKQKCGIIERENYNKPKSENVKQPQCPPEKEKAIKEALKHFGMV